MRAAPVVFLQQQFGVVFHGDVVFKAPRQRVRVGQAVVDALRLPVAVGADAAGVADAAVGLAADHAFDAVLVVRGFVGVAGSDGAGVGGPAHPFDRVVGFGHIG